MTLHVLEFIPVPVGTPDEAGVRLLNWAINLIVYWAITLLPIKLAIKLVQRS